MTDAEIDALVALPEPEPIGWDFDKVCESAYGYTESQLIEHTRAAVRAALTATLQVKPQPVAEVEGWSNGSYCRNYKLNWLQDVPAGTKLYAEVPQAESLTEEQRKNSERYIAWRDSMTAGDAEFTKQVAAAQRLTLLQAGT